VARLDETARAARRSISPKISLEEDRQRTISTGRKTVARNSTHLDERFIIEIFQDAARSLETRAIDERATDKAGIMAATARTRRFLSSRGAHL